MYVFISHAANKCIKNVTNQRNFPLYLLHTNSIINRNGIRWLVINEENEILRYKYINPIPH